MARFTAAEKELEAEIVDVVQEANTFRQGWGGMIFQTATEMAQAEKTREMVMSINKIRSEESASCLSSCPQGVADDALDRKLLLRKKYLPDTVVPPPFQIPAAAMAQLQAQAQAQAAGGASANASPARIASQTAAAAAIAPQSQTPSPAKVSPGNGSGQASGASTPMDMESSGELVSTPAKASGAGQSSSTPTPSKVRTSVVRVDAVQTDKRRTQQRRRRARSRHCIAIPIAYAQSDAANINRSIIYANADKPDHRRTTEDRTSSPNGHLAHGLSFSLFQHRCTISSRYPARHLPCLVFCRDDPTQSRPLASTGDRR